MSFSRSPRQADLKVYDALIVGFGPVGATLANLLARRGLDIAVIDGTADIYDKPRAISLDHEVMRIFQACGLAHDIARLTAPHPGTHYLGMDGRVIRKMELQPPPYPLGWIPNVTFVQPVLEGQLRKGLAGAANVDVLLGEPVVGLAQDENGAELPLLTLRDGTTLRGCYVLACDGANSFVRRQLDIGVEDLEFDEWWMVVDVRVPPGLALPAKSIQYCRPWRPATFVIGPGDLRRWEIKMLPGENPEEFGRPENVVRLLAEFVDPARIKVWRSAVYRFHALLAERWQQGRAFLLGDACHQTPPFLGQGMCAGIRDAANLAWKLVAVLRDGAQDALLESYEMERKPHVRRLVALAKEFGLLIGELDPHAARERDERLRGALERGEAETIRQRYIPGLTAGLIDADPLAGTLFVQPRVRVPAGDAPVDAGGDALVGAGGDALMDDVVPFRFLIVTAGAEAQTWLSEESRRRWQRLGGERVIVRSEPSPPAVPADAASAPATSVPAASAPAAIHDIRELIECGRLFADWVEKHGCAAAVVRPDRYVFGVAHDAAGLNRLVSRVCAGVMGPAAEVVP